MSYTDFDFPHTHMYDSDLREILRQLKVIINTLNEFIPINTIKFADPIQWDITKQYEKSTIVTNSNIAYLSIDEVPKGISIDDENYWLKIFDFADFLDRISKDFSVIQQFGDIASVHIDMNRWFMLNYQLGIAISDIEPGDGFSSDNTRMFTLEELWTEFLATYSEEFESYKNSIDDDILSYKTQINGEIEAFENSVPTTINNAITNLTENLEAQLAEAISGVTADSEVINARIGADGYTYDTLGVAIRSQFRAIEFYKFNAQTHYCGTLVSGGSFYRTAGMTDASDNFIFVPISPGDTIEITPNANGATVAFLDSMPTLPLAINTPVVADFSDNFPSRISVAPSRTLNVTVYDNAAYLYIMTTTGGTDVTPSVFRLNGVDYASTLTANVKDIYGYNNNRYDIGRQLSFDNIINSPSISEDNDRVAHCSAFAVDDYGLAIAAYYGNENQLVEDYSDTSDAHVKIERFNVASPEKHEMLIKMSDGYVTDAFTIVKGCPANPNVAYNNGKFYVTVAAWWGDNNDLDDYDFRFKEFIYDTALNDFEKVGSVLKTYTPVISHSGNDYEMSNSGITDLLGALGITATDPFVQWTSNHAYNSNGYYYSIICAIYKKAFIVRTMDFIHYEFVKLLDDGVNDQTPEAGIQFVNNSLAIISYRVNDTATRGTYWATFNLSNSTITYKGKISDSNTKPCVVKDFTNNVIIITGYPNKLTPLFLRNGMQGLRYNPYEDTLSQIFKWDDYATAIHYPCAYTRSRITFISFTTGLKQNRTGTDYDTIQFTKFGYIQ